jgi:hypothetical protein
MHAMDLLLATAAVLAVPALLWAAVWLSFRSERAFHRALARHEDLDDAQFYEQYDAGTNVPQDVVRRLRPVYCSFFGIDAFKKLRPSDRPPEIDELDTVQLVRDIEREFCVKVPDAESEGLSGSFDSIARYLAERLTIDDR